MTYTILLLVVFATISHSFVPHRPRTSQLGRTLRMGIDVSGLKVVPIPEDMMNQLSTSAAANSDNGGFLDVAGQSDIYTDIQNVLILVAGVSYLAYEKRPRGSVRDDLVDIRRSGIPGANLGLYSSVFIAQGTLLGTFPGFLLKAEDAFANKKNKDATECAKQYIWSVAEDLVLDPTNDEGKLELDIKYVYW